MHPSTCMMNVGNDFAADYPQTSRAVGTGRTVPPIMPILVAFRAHTATRDSNQRRHAVDRWSGTTYARRKLRKWLMRKEVLSFEGVDLKAEEAFGK